jgi:anion-transporting  ArsA/GET3 family ATPase
MAPTALFDRRLLILAGKGGAGRTTVAAALARAAVNAGKRVLLAQTNAPPRLAHLLGCPEAVGSDIVAVGERLWAVNMNQRAALREYMLKVLRYDTLYRALFENRAMRSFLGALPGLEAWAMLGKTWWHTTEREDGRFKYDLVILDGPGSGHILTMLRAPAAVQAAMPMGPLARPAAAAHALLSDPDQAALLIVTLAEELPARETVVLARGVRESLRIPLGPLIVNAMPPEAAGRPELRSVLEHVENVNASSELISTLAGATILAARRSDAERILENLARDPGLPMIQLPRMPTNDLGPAEIEQLSRLLAEDALARALPARD